MADMEGNVGKDLAADKKKEVIDEKFYRDVEVALKKDSQSKAFNAKILAERKMQDENGEYKEYDIYLKFKGENIKVATIDKKGNTVPNYDLLQDEKYTDEDKKKLGDLLNLLGLEQNKVDVNKLQEKLKELEAKTKEEIERENEKQRDDGDDSIKDEGKDDETDKDEEDKNLEDDNEEEQQEEVANKMHVRKKDIFFIKPTSQFFKNHPEVPKTTFFFRDDDGKFKARYFDKNGSIKESEYFKDSTTSMIEQYVNLGTDGENVKMERPCQVMKTEKLKARNTQEIRMAARLDEHGYLEFEEIRQGTNGKWTGYGLEAKGRDRNSKVVDELSNTRTNKVEPANVSDRFEAVEKSGLADDGVQLPDLSPQKTIERFIEEGYNKEEATEIYDYMVGYEHLSEEAAKEKENEKIEERIELEDKNKDGRSQGDEAYERLVNKH